MQLASPSELEVQRERRDGGKRRGAATYDSKIINFVNYDSFGFAETHKRSRRLGIRRVPAHVRPVLNSGTGDNEWRRGGGLGHPDGC